MGGDKVGSCLSNVPATIDETLITEALFEIITTTWQDPDSPGESAEDPSTLPHLPGSTEEHSATKACKTHYGLPHRLCLVEIENLRT